MSYPFKNLFIPVVSLLVAYTARADNGGRGKPKSSEGQIQVRFSNHINNIHKDSVLIIFDRYNHSGAGIIYKTFSVDSNHSVFISRIPAGKYFIMIQFTGIHHDYWEGISWVRSKKCGTIKIRLERSEEFTKEKVVIPSFRPDPMKLSIIRIKARGGARQSKSYPIF